MAALKNVSSWRLNAAEKEELQRRVAAGEEEITVKRELQTLKAQASLDRKLAADAVANRCVAQAKQAAKAKARGKAAAKAAPAALQPDPQNQGDVDLINKEYYSQVQADLHRILAEFGVDFDQQMPQKISSDKDAAGNALGGVQEPYDKDKAKVALSSHGVYRCSVSAFWFNALCSPTPGVPMSRRRVEELCEFSYGPEGAPRFHTDRMVEVAINQDEVDTDRPSNLQMVSPEEVLHATLAGCVRAIEPEAQTCCWHIFLISKPFFSWMQSRSVQFFFKLRCKETLTDDDWIKKRTQWKAVLLSIPCSFCLMAKQDQWKVAFNKRQAIAQDHCSLTRTAMQSSMEVAQFKAILEANAGGVKLTPPALATELSKQGLQSVVNGTALGDEDEAVEGSLTATFISQALNIHKNVMAQPACVEILMSLEARYGSRSCFHQLSKLNVLASKPSSPKTRVWILQSIDDWLTYGLIRVGDISKTVLQGDRTHCGLVQLFETKQKASSLHMI